MVRGRVRGLAMVTTGLAVLLLAGCAPPDGIDGDLTGGWAALSAPVGWLPEVGTCHQSDYQPGGPLFEYFPVDCREPHRTETVHVGQFTGEAADRVTPPPEGSAGWRSAYAECDEAAAEYLGADFRHGRLWLGVTLPSVAGWEGGGRWFRCEVIGYEAGESTSVFQDREGSLAGALAGDSELLLRCFEATAGDEVEVIDQMEPVACDEPHDTEFVGVWQAPDIPYPDPDDGASLDRVRNGCREQVAEYVDVPADGSLIFRTGIIVTWIGELAWDNGDGRFRCYLYLVDAGLTESLEGAGTTGLPVR